MSIGFERFSCGLPNKRVTVSDLAVSAGYDEVVGIQLERQGLVSIPVAENLLEVSNIALGGLRLDEDSRLDRVSGIILAHSIPRSFTIDDNWFRIFEDAGLRGVPRFALSGQPCSIMHFAVQVAVRWLGRLLPDSLILVLGADVAETPKDRIFFNSAMGDSAVACLVGNYARNDHILATNSRSRLYAFEGEDSPAEAIAAFRSVSPSNLRSTIDECLRKAGVGWQDIRYVAPHTPYRKMWEIMSEFLDIPIGKVLLNYMGSTGHLNSNDSFCHYWQAVLDGRIEQGDLVLLVNPGFGGTWGCTLLQR